MPENREERPTTGDEAGRSEGGAGPDETIREDAGRASTLGGSSNRGNPSDGPGGGATNVRGDRDATPDARRVDE